MFQISTGDINLLAGSPYTYTVRSELINYPGYGVKTAEGKIVLLDPCMAVTNDDIQVGTPDHTDTDYSK